MERIENHLIDEELRLMKHTENDICVSIIVPTPKLSFERNEDAKEVQVAIEKAKNELQLKYPKIKIRLLLQSLDELYHNIKFNNNSKGIGLFVSKQTRQFRHFYFDVKERVMISNEFDIRDWLYQIYYLTPYFLLLISEKEAKLFLGQINDLTEIKDRRFPFHYEEGYNYHKPSRGASFKKQSFVKEFERDKTELQEIHLKSFLREVEEALNKYASDGTPIIVCGTVKNIAYYKQITHNKDIVGKIEGNYNYTSIHELGSLAWKVMKNHLDEEKKRIVEGIHEKSMNGVITTGIYDIWKAVQEGRGLQLIVEKDLSMPGYLLKGNNYDLYLQLPFEKYSILPDVVNTLMELTLKKNGKVVIVDNGELAEFQRIALITRY